MYRELISIAVSTFYTNFWVISVTNLLLAVQNTSPKEQIVFYSAAKEHTIITTVTSGLLHRCHAPPPSKRKRGILEWQDMGIRVTAPLLLCQGTHGNLGNLREFNEGAVYSKHVKLVASGSHACWPRIWHAWSTAMYQGTRNLTRFGFPSYPTSQNNIYMGGRSTSGSEGAKMWGAVPRI